MIRSVIVDDEAGILQVSDVRLTARDSAESVKPAA
jgi:hypothetical protein